MRASSAATAEANGRLTKPQLETNKIVGWVTDYIANQYDLCKNQGGTGFNHHGFNRPDKTHSSLRRPSPNVP